VLPLWQRPQFAVIPAWFIRAPANVIVLLWQVSHGAVVTTWFGRFPEAPTPLWHLMQPSMMPAWLPFFPFPCVPDGIGVCVLETPVPGVVVLAEGVAAAVGALVLGGITAPEKVTVLKWQVLQAASVGGWVADFPIAILLL
jgi:hypothetical protein